MFFANERATYTVYLLKKNRGTRDCRGSVAVEQNHSSVFSFLNCGAKGMNQYCESPMKLIKDLFARQKKHINKWNELLAVRSNKMSIKLRHFNKIYLLKKTPILLMQLQVWKLCPTTVLK